MIAALALTAPPQPERGGLLRRLAGDSGYVWEASRCGRRLRRHRDWAVGRAQPAGVRRRYARPRRDSAGCPPVRRYRALAYSGGAEPTQEPADLPAGRSGRRHLETHHDPTRPDPVMARRRARHPVLPDRGGRVLHRRHVVGDGDRRHTDRRVGLEHSARPGQPIARPADRARRQHFRQGRPADGHRVGLPGHSPVRGSRLRARPWRASVVPC